MRVLVAGASIAGPAVAYWLDRYGFDVVVVERAAHLRGGGYPIDIRGTAVDVVQRMGIYPRLREAHVATRGISFVNGAGSPITELRPDVMTGSDDSRDVEVQRGDLALALYDATRERVEYRFSEVIVSLDETDGGVDVGFGSGRRERFDLVIAADGLHSSTRGLVFGPEQPFHRYIGYCFAGFTMPNVLDLSREGVIWSVPGRSAAMYGVRGQEAVHGFLCLALSEPPFDAFRDPQAQRNLVAEAYAGDGWLVPEMIKAMQSADDLFFDLVSQIRMPRWSAGRLVLVGDAAYAPSFLTGQGSSLALVGAYLLAGELANSLDHRTAFEAYEKIARPFVELNQDRVQVGEATLFPRTADALEKRNRMLSSLSALPGDSEPAHSALELPDYFD